MKNLKKLLEKRSLLLADMNKLTDAALTAERSMDEAELAEFNKLKEQVADLNKTIEALEALAAEEPKEAPAEPESTEERSLESTEELETRALAAYIRATAAGNQTRDLDIGSNGGILGKTVVNKIITKAIEISPILSQAQKFLSRGNLTVPVWGDGIQVAYRKQFKKLTASIANMEAVDLKSYLMGALVVLDKALLNETDIDLTSYVIERMAEALSSFLDTEFLTGSTAEDEIKGISAATKVLTANAANAITADELLKLRDMIPSKKRSGAMYVMRPETITACQLLKDGDGTYLLQKDATSEWGYSIFGHPVYPADGMPEMGAGNNAVVFINAHRGVGFKAAKDIEVSVLKELFADQYGLGLAAWCQADVEVIDTECCAVLRMAE